MNNDNWILTYYQQIENGTVTVGKWVRLLYERIIRDLENKEYFFDQRKANRAINFIEKFCHHSKGKLAPRLVKLEVWQKAMLSCIFGLVDEKGLRVYREVFCVVARKCGKSLLASGIAEYVAYADGEIGADTYFIAPKLDQADIVFSDFWQSVSHEPDLMRMTKKRKMDIYIESTNTSIKKIPFSEKKSDGYNPQLSCCDEIAAWVGDSGIKQYTVLTSALGSREQPIVLSITTANYISDGIYDELYKRATAFLKGNSREKRLLPFIYQIDDVAKWNDINELRKSIPNLGVSVSVDYIIEEISKAEESLVAKREFMTKFANIKQNSASCWFNTSDIAKSFPSNRYSLEDFANTYGLVGVDLSRTTDLSAAVVLIERKGIIYYFAHFWLPAEKIAEATARDGLPYEIYIQRGLLTATEGHDVDYKSVRDWIIGLYQKYSIYVQWIGYDRYSAQPLVQDLSAFGFHTESVFQGNNLTGIINSVEGMMKNGVLQCADDNDLMKVHWMDAALESDSSGRQKLIKVTKNAHVDGVAAILDAVCMRHNHWEELSELLKNEV